MIPNTFGPSSTVMSIISEEFQLSCIDMIMTKTLILDAFQDDRVQLYCICLSCHSCMIRVDDRERHDKFEDATTSLTVTKAVFGNREVSTLLTLSWRYAITIPK